MEPQTVVTSGSRILVAGNPTYVWYLTDGRVSAVGRDSIFGIVVDRNGRATAIPSPFPPGHVHAVRAAAHDNGQWAVVFAEADPPARFAGPLVLKGYWFGITDGVRWLHMERLPTTRGKLNVDFASSLVRTVSGYAIALPDDGEDRSRAAVFTQRHGQWSIDYVGVGATYTSLTTNGHELALGSVYSDTLPQNPVVAATDHNSLWLYQTTGKGMRWGERSRLVHGVGQPVHHPAFAWAKEGLQAAWMSIVDGTRETRIGAIRSDTLVFTDRLIRETQEIVSTPTAAGRPLWLTIDNVNGAEAWLRIWTIVGSKTSTVVARKTPFDGVAGFAVLDRTIIVVGPMRGAGPYDPAVTLHLHSFPMNCN